MTTNDRKRPRTYRAKLKKARCPVCGHKYKMEGTEGICPECQEEAEQGGRKS